MIIYRIEHKKVKNKKAYAGPYGVSDLVSSGDWSRSNSSIETHPTPFQDPILSLHFPFATKSMSKYHFGFKNIKDLKKWFNSRELKNLKKLNFIIVQYKAEKVLNGTGQVMFIPDKKIKRKIVRNIT